MWLLGVRRDAELAVSQTGRAGCEASAAGGLAAKAMAFPGQDQ